jgi:hypothetical protein
MSVALFLSNGALREGHLPRFQASRRMHEAWPRVFRRPPNPTLRVLPRRPILPYVPPLLSVHHSEVQR